ncbi:MAG: PAS domain S-box protein [Chthoniobacteraceae bacterium]
MDNKKIKVLMVDDNRDYFVLVQRMFASTERHQFDLTWAPSYEVAVEQLHNPYDVALLDFRLGGYTGMDVLKEAQKIGCTFPMIIMTGMTDPSLDQQVVAAGAADFLPKNEITAALLERSIYHAIERVRAQEALRESELKFRSITEAAAEGIIAADSDGKIVSWNTGARAMFGYTAEEILGKPITELIASRSREEIREEMEQLLAGVSASMVMGTGQLFGVSAGGSEFPVEISISTWLVGALRFVGLVIRDITQRVLAENRLAEERNLLKSIIDNLPDHVYVKDLQGRYIVNNAAHLAFIGAGDPKEIIGKTAFDLYPPDLASRTQMDDLAVIRSNRPSIEREEPTVDRPHGEHVWLSTSKIPLVNTDSRVAGLVCLSRDITTRKQAEVARAQSEQALRKAVDDLRRSNSELRDTQMMLIHAEKLESLGRLSAGIAHEVKNPLNQLLLGTEFLQHAIPPEEATWAEVLTDMRGAIMRMDRILRGMLEYSAPNELDLKAEDLNETLESALVLLRLELIKSHITVEKSLAGGLPRVDLDRTKIEQVLINLFGNAMHAMPNGGKVIVKTYSEISLTGERDHGAKKNERLRAGDTIVVMEISDSGHGIPEEKIAKIFDPFFTTKPTGKGTGLGLTVSKKIIELHGGTLELLNRPEGGVTARIGFKGLVEQEAGIATLVDTQGQAA